MLETTQTFTNGTVQIADEVVAIIAGTAALEAEGVCPVDPAEAKHRKLPHRGVKIGVSDNQVNVSLSISVKQGYKIGDVTHDAQQKVKTAIETMTGMLVSSVDVNVMSLAGVKS
jgi:uncharacterized alkaline shock family protein YloU